MTSMQALLYRFGLTEDEVADAVAEQFADVPIPGAAELSSTDVEVLSDAELVIGSDAVAARRRARTATLVDQISLLMGPSTAEVAQAAGVSESRVRHWASVTRPVELLDLTGAWATRAGASQLISSGPRPRAQKWARQIAAAWPQMDGVWYRSSMLGGGYCAALWSPAADAMPNRPVLSVPLSHAALWRPLALICEQIGYRLG